MLRCVPNLGPRQRRRRLILGVFALALSGAAALLLVAAPLPLRALIVLPLLSAAHGFFQYREKT